MKKRTLGFKLVAGGIMAVLIPLVVVGLYSVNKASDALVTLSNRPGGTGCPGSGCHDRPGPSTGG